MSAHKYIEDSSFFEDIENRTYEVVPITAAHEAIKLGKREAYQELLTFIQTKREVEAASSEFEIALDLIEDYIKRKIK